MGLLFKKYSTYILSIIIIVFTTISFIMSSYYSSLTNITVDYSKIDLNEIDNLMIVSHPTDEILFGGSHLLEDNYLVVCITCGTDKELTHDFIDVLQKTKDKYIILGYPEYSNDERENWSNYKTNIKEDITKIIKLKDWSTIVTHNPEGEYGSLQHKLTSQIVTSISPKKKLYYFGKYYTKKSIVNEQNKLSQINQNRLNQKIKLIGMYKTETYIQTEFNHMYKYEEWIKYKEWSK
ncbi:MAG: PIG-L family deacetylase [Firmicutes bacterium]|nr:PIG-L family deacetylase [Bacillota bacterium]